MKTRTRLVAVVRPSMVAAVLSVSMLAAIVVAVEASAARRRASAPPPPPFAWTTVVNNNDVIPGDPAGRTFNSYNQPSVNVRGLVVIRARSRGGSGGEPAHGIFTRDMSLGDDPANPIVRILDKNTAVPQPNNLGTLFVEPPAFPRIDMGSDTIATRGNHEPVWNYVVGTDPETGEDIETRAGTTGIYTNPLGGLVTGASKLGAVPGFELFAVPDREPPIPFDVYPGAPSVTDRSTIVFKGNFTVEGIGKTGVFYRDLGDGPIGGAHPVVTIAETTHTRIPGSDELFGSTAPPSAANELVVFSGFDNEDAPTLGGIYLTTLGERPSLTPLVPIGGRVPGEPVGTTFNKLGEGNAFDGRYVGFWGAWEPEARTVRLYCPTEGNKDRIDYCNQQLVCADTGEILGDPDSICDETGCYQDKQVPVHQGIFVHDTAEHTTWAVAKTAEAGRFSEFVFWVYSGKTPCVGGGHTQEGAEDDGEPARWRSSAFVAVSGTQAAFKAVAGDAVGIHLATGPELAPVTVLDSRTDGQSVDPEAPAGSIVTELGLEREGLRGDWLTLTATMGVEGGTEEEGLAGVYITRLPHP